MWHEQQEKYTSLDLEKIKCYNNKQLCEVWTYWLMSNILRILPILLYKPCAVLPITLK